MRAIRYKEAMNMRGCIVQLKSQSAMRAIRYKDNFLKWAEKTFGNKVAIRYACNKI